MDAGVLRFADHRSSLLLSACRVEQDEDLIFGPSVLAIALWRRLKRGRGVCECEPRGSVRYRAFASPAQKIGLVQ